jgi:hypothetical protein
MPFWMYPRTRSRCADETSGPSSGRFARDLLHLREPRLPLRHAELVRDRVGNLVASGFELLRDPVQEQ